MKLIRISIHFPNAQNFFSSLSTVLHGSPPQAASTSTSLLLDLKVGPQVVAQELHGDHVAHIQGRGQLVTSWSRRSRLMLGGVTPGQVISSVPSLQSSFPSQTFIRLTQPQTNCNRKLSTAGWGTRTFLAGELVGEVTLALTRLITPILTVLMAVTDLGEAHTGRRLTCVCTPELSQSTVAETALFILPSSTVWHQVTTLAAGNTTPVQTLELNLDYSHLLILLCDYTISAASPLCNVLALRLVGAIKAVKVSVANLVQGQAHAGSQTTKLLPGTLSRGRGGESPGENLNKTELWLWLSLPDTLYQYEDAEDDKPVRTKVVHGEFSIQTATLQSLFNVYILYTKFSTLSHSQNKHSTFELWWKKNQSHFINLKFILIL